MCCLLVAACCWLLLLGRGCDYGCDCWLRACLLSSMKGAETKHIGPALARHVACARSIRILLLLGVLFLLIGVLTFGLAQTCANDDLLRARGASLNLLHESLARCACQLACALMQVAWWLCRRSKPWVGTTWGQVQRLDVAHPLRRHARHAF